MQTDRAFCSARTCLIGCMLRFESAQQSRTGSGSLTSCLHIKTALTRTLWCALFRPLDRQSGKGAGTTAANDGNEAFEVRLLFLLHEGKADHVFDVTSLRARQRSWWIRLGLACLSCCNACDNAVQEVFLKDLADVDHHIQEPH